MTAYLTFEADGSGTLKFNGKEYQCHGNNKYDYKADITLRPNDCYLRKYSAEYGVYMDYCVGPIHGQRGLYIHQGDISETAGCVHLDGDDAVAFYNYVKGQNRTRLITSKPW